MTTHADLHPMQARCGGEPYNYQFLQESKIGLLLTNGLMLRGSVTGVALSEGVSPSSARLMPSTARLIACCRLTANQYLQEG